MKRPACFDFEKSAAEADCAALQISVTCGLEDLDANANEHIVDGPWGQLDIIRMLGAVGLLRRIYVSSPKNGYVYHLRMGRNSIISRLVLVHESL